jgi:hypothetical protein
MHEIYNTCMSYVQSGVISFLLRAIKQSSIKGVIQFGIREIKQSSRKGVLQFGIRAMVSTQSLDGPVEQSLDPKCEGNWV